MQHQLVLDFDEWRGKPVPNALSAITSEIFDIGHWCSTNNVSAEVSIGRNQCEFVVTLPTDIDAIHFKLRWSARLKNGQGDNDPLPIPAKSLGDIVVDDLRLLKPSLLKLLKLI